MQIADSPPTGQQMEEHAGGISGTEQANHNNVGVSRTQIVTFREMCMPGCIVEFQRGLRFWCSCHGNSAKCKCNRRDEGHICKSVFSVLVPQS